MSDTADLLQQLIDIRRKVASENFTGGHKKRKSLAGGKKKSPKRRNKKSPKRRPGRKKSPTRRPGIRQSQAKTTAGKRRAVWEGRLRSTTGGLTKKDLKLNKQGKVVSKKASDAAKNRLNENPALKTKFKEQRKLMKHGLIRRRN